MNCTTQLAVPRVVTPLTRAGDRLQELPVAKLPPPSLVQATNPVGVDRPEELVSCTVAVHVSVAVATMKLQPTVIALARSLPGAGACGFGPTLLPPFIHTSPAWITLLPFLQT